ncbi:MAG: hypothetical protein DRP85_09050 [Candidatus Makaraimicrobium thalassicum]|nr:MAG: hypothetical protein DRP85_09050 [Candidatus Omnitrophota bacterium]
MRTVYVFEGNIWHGCYGGKILKVTFDPSKGMDGFYEALENAPSVTGDEYRYISPEEWNKYGGDEILEHVVHETGEYWTHCPVCGGGRVYEGWCWICEKCGEVLGAEY